VPFFCFSRPRGKPTPSEAARGLAGPPPPVELRLPSIARSTCPQLQQPGSAWLPMLKLKLEKEDVGVASGRLVELVARTIVSFVEQV
jgi:hypothetical protein